MLFFDVLVLFSFHQLINVKGMLSFYLFVAISDFVYLKGCVCVIESWGGDLYHVNFIIFFSPRFKTNLILFFWKFTYQINSDLLYLIVILGECFYVVFTLILMPTSFESVFFFHEQVLCVSSNLLRNVDAIYVGVIDFSVGFMCFGSYWIAFLYIGSDYLI